MNKHPKIENLKHFQPGQSGNPKGRPKSKAAADLKELFTPAELREIKSISPAEAREWDAYLLVMTVPQLQALAKADHVSAYARAICVAILTDMKNGKTRTIDQLNERVNGKREPRKIELTGKDGADLIPARTLTAEEAAEFIDQLQRDY